MKSILIPIFLLSIYSFAAFSELTFDQTTDIIGKPQITDGDTIVMNGIKIRFTGSDAPESYFFGKTQICKDSAGQDWECGKAATEKLKQLINNQTVRCSDEGKDRYGRTLGICHVRDMDLQAEMVKSGMAVAYLRYSNRYEQEQNFAKKAKAGMWSGEFLEPETWRRENRN
ncbi:MAG: thermonuclease family protein [Gammaproteobacteria bacterium]|nr:MAG: thermonuclease family protein [Gammaproteobacteria bacterium TMED236]|tara:strand:- start:4125 stop:4637 length:513 start_codon:yes stop_codon:yes gene_type:complete